MPDGAETYTPATDRANERYKGDVKALDSMEWQKQRAERIASGTTGILTDEIFAAILAELRTGTALRQALAPYKISKWVFYNHIDKSALSADQYARARAASLDAMAEEAMGIADDASIPSDHKRIMVDTRRWLLSKLAPKRYGDHLELTVSGGNLVGMSETELIALAMQGRPALAAPVSVQDTDAPE